MTDALRLPRPFLLIPWGLAAFIAFSTLGPQHLRPHLPAQVGPQLERFGAYFLMALTFALTYPNRKGLIAVSGTVAAILLELGQGMVPGRDPGLPDVVKAITIQKITDAAISATRSQRAWKDLSNRAMCSGDPRHVV